MRVRLALVLALCMVLVAVVGVPASAKVDNNPNVLVFTDLTCADDSIIDGTAYIMPGGSHSGFGDDFHGVAKSAFLYLSEADAMADTGAIEVLLDNPGNGHAKNTVWCWWYIPAFGVWGAGDVLFNGPR